MRLICPNCDAQYEVPDDVVPAAGRDVQCSNCGNTWFFKPVDPADLAAEEDAAVHTSVAPPPAPEPAPAPEEPPAPAQAERRKLDPAVADVLREEAEYEARARAAEREVIETQPDLGLDDLEPQDEASRRAAEARTRMARMRGEEVVDAPSLTAGGGAAAAAGALAAATAAEQTRRDLLPNVDEINSTLRSDEDRYSPQDTEAPHREVEPKKRRGFRTGFFLILFLAALAIAAYIFAPQISEAVPQLAAPLGEYVTWVNGLRGWLDGQVLSLLSMLDGMSSEAPASE